jgi:hypothetical protein
MSDFNFYPLAGMNTVDPDTDMIKKDNKGRRVYARDLINGRVDSAGTWEKRPGAAKVSATPLANLWFSERFNDTLATQGTNLVRVFEDWSTQVLADVGGYAKYLELNSTVIIAGNNGVYELSGETLQPLTIENGFVPYIAASASGGLAAGEYAIAVSLRRGTKEGAVSETSHVVVDVGGGVTVSLSGLDLLDTTATHITVYASHPNGGELYAVETVPINTQTVELGASAIYGKLATNRWLTKMPTGSAVRFWRGRLVTVSSNTLYFSEALNYHLHDPRTGYIQLPTKITFIEPVDGGLWVGQKNDVVFLSGAEIQNLSVDYKNVLPPVPWSSTLINSELVSEKVSDSGGTTACWLAANGYVLGTSDGVIHEMSAGVLSGLSAVRGQTVAHDRFLLTITN